MADGKPEKGGFGGIFGKKPPPSGPVSETSSLSKAALDTTSVGTSQKIDTPPPEAGNKRNKT